MPRKNAVPNTIYVEFVNHETPDAFEKVATDPAELIDADSPASPVVVYEYRLIQCMEVSAEIKVRQVSKE